MPGFTPPRPKNNDEVLNFFLSFFNEMKEERGGPGLSNGMGVDRAYSSSKGAGGLGKRNVFRKEKIDNGHIGVASAKTGVFGGLS